MHGNGGNTRRYRQLLNGGFLRRAALADPAFTPLQVMFKILEGFVLFSWLWSGFGFGNTDRRRSQSSAGVQASKLSVLVERVFSLRQTENY